MDHPKTTPFEIAARHGIDLNHELTSGFAAKRIREISRIWSGKTRESRQDVFQNLSLRLLERINRFDPTRATWEGFVLKVLKSCCANLFELRYRKRRFTTIPVLSLDVRTDDEDGQPTTLGSLLLSVHQAVDPTNSSECTFEQLDLRGAIRDIIATLTPREQRICRLLGENSVRATQRKLRVSRRRMDHLFRKIRKALEEAGFGGDFATCPSKLVAKRGS